MLLSSHGSYDGASKPITADKAVLEGLSREEAPQTVGPEAWQKSSTRSCGDSMCQAQGASDVMCEQNCVEEAGARPERRGGGQPGRPWALGGCAGSWSFPAPPSGASEASERRVTDLSLVFTGHSPACGTEHILQAEWPEGDLAKVGARQSGHRGQICLQIE